MTVAALAGSAAWWAVGAAVVADAAIIGGTAYSAYSSYEQGVAAEQAAKAQAEQYKAQAAILEQQAKENERQASYENTRAGIAQLQGEQEAAAKMRQRAAQIGSTYATAAGNGILVHLHGEVAIILDLRRGRQYADSHHQQREQNAFHLPDPFVSLVLFFSPLKYLTSAAFTSACSRRSNSSFAYFSSAALTISLRDAA